MKRLCLILVSILTFGYTTPAFALGECGLACCLAGAATSGVTLATRFGLSLQYEYTFMETLREGKDSISPDTLLDRKASEWPMMPMETKRFSVLREMTKFQKPIYQDANGIQQVVAWRVLASIVWNF